MRWFGNVRRLPRDESETKTQIGALTNLLEKDADPGVRAMAAFAIGEIESEAGANALLSSLKNKSGLVELRARTIEALGKIAAALPREKEARQRELGAAILETLKAEPGQSAANTSLVLLGVTAVLRSRPADAGPTLAKFLTSSNSRVRADVANALARLRLKDGNDQLRKTAGIRSRSGRARECGPSSRRK